MNRIGMWVAAALFCCALGQASFGVERDMAYGRQLPRKFDEYGDVRVGDEKLRLDNFVVELQNDPGSVGYIIVYAGRRSRAGLARARAIRARNFLIESRGMQPERVVWIDGGRRERLTTELFILPRGTPPPSPTPTVYPSEIKPTRDVKRSPSPRKRT